jgi:hypothetical protein
MDPAKSRCRILDKTTDYPAPMPLRCPYERSGRLVLRALGAYAAFWMVATPSRAALLPVHISRGGVQSYLYANRVGFFVG